MFANMEGMDQVVAMLQGVPGGMYKQQNVESSRSGAFAGMPNAIFAPGFEPQQMQMGAA